MIKSRYLPLLLALVFGPLVVLAHSQALPTVTRSGGYFGFQIPEANGTVQYSLTASDSVTFGYNGSDTTANSANLSGNLAFISNSQKYPTTILYTGAYLINTTGQPSTFVQSLAVTQSAIYEKWKFTISDAVSYLPSSPNSGLSGVAGLGDQNINAPPGTTTTFNGFLSGYSPRVANVVSASVSRSITGKTSVTVSDSYSMLRFLDEGTVAGENSNSNTITAFLSHRIDARDNIGAAYSYSKSTFPGYPVAFDTQSAVVQFSRNLSRKLTFTAAAGPQRSSSTGSTVLFPSTTSITASAGISYTGKVYNLTLSYSRGTNSGFGVVTGAHTDTLSFAGSRRLARNLQGSAGLSYGRSTSLAVTSGNNPAFSEQAVTGNAQVSYRINRDLSAYSSYTASHQLTSGTGNSPIAFNGLAQTFAVGITFSPPGRHFGR